MARKQLPVRPKKELSVTVVDEPPSAHAKRSPSTAKNREQCPGFEPRSVESEWSAEGTQLHRYMEIWVQNYYKEEGTKERLDESAKLWNVFTDEQIEQVQKLINFVTPFCDGAEEWHEEVKLDLRSLELPGCDFGTADLVLVHPGNVVHAIDYKFGKIEVDDAQDNAQAQIYSLGIFARFPECNQVDFHMLQPRLDQVSHGSFKRSDIPAMLLRAKTIFERVDILDEVTLAAWSVKAGVEIYNGPESLPLNPQTQLCEYCSRIGTCPAVARFALRVTEGPEMPAEIVPDMVKDDPEKLGALFQWARLLEAKGEALRENISELAKAGNEVGGFMLQSSTGRSSVIDPVGLAAELRKIGFSEEDIYLCSELSLTKALDLVGKRAPDGEKEKSKQAVRADLLDSGFFRVGLPFSFLKRSK